MNNVDKDNKDQVSVTNNANQSNARAIAIVIVFVVLFVGLIAFEVYTRK
jgi:FtsH-binding integral membrane protein